MTRIAVRILVALALCGLAAAQTAPTISARLSSGVVRLGDPLGLLIAVEGASSPAVGPLPVVDGLRFGKVSRLPEVRLEEWDGRRVRKSLTLTFGIEIEPLRKGDFTIPPIAVTVDGKSHATPELLLKVVEDLRGEELGALEIDAPAQVFESQPFWLEIRFGYDAALGELGRDVDYFDLSLPWLGQLPGLLELDSPGPPHGLPRVDGVILNSRGTTTAERLAPARVGERTMTLMRIRKRYVATRPGKLEFPVSHLEFGKVEANFFNLRPREKSTYFKRFPAFAIDVVELPETGRPFDFTGAVGTITATADADRRDVDAGESIKLSVEWTGEGNLEFFDPPDLERQESFEGFRVYGTRDRVKSPGRRVVEYDLAPLSPSVQSIPPIPLQVFDPSARTYVAISTKPIPLRVRPLKGAVAEAEAVRLEPAFDIRDIQARSESGSDQSQPGGGVLIAALLSVPILWLSLRTLVRRRGDPDAPRQRARRAARRRLARDLSAAHSASSQARALHRFLAARTGEPEQAWVGRDAIAWCRDRGPALRLSSDDTRELAALMSRLDERAWAGRDEPVDARVVAETADRLIRGNL